MIRQPLGPAFISFECPVLMLASDLGTVSAYVCPTCSQTHVVFTIHEGIVCECKLTEDQAFRLAQMLINPPTLEGLDAA